MEIVIEKEKAITLLNQEVKDVEDRGRIRVTSQETLEEALETRKLIKEVSKIVDTKKKAMTDPIRQGLEEIRGFFKPYEERIKTVDTWLSGQILTWTEKKEAEARAKAKAEEDKIKEGKTTMEKAGKAIARAEEKVKAVPIREITKLRIIDESKLPREYLMPDEDKIFAALKEGKKVEGAELYKEKILINR